MKDYYQILEVTQESEEDEIRKNYRRLAMQYHPDRNPGKPGAEEKFKEIAEAYGVLTDPVKRRQYDATRNMGADRYQTGSRDGFNYSQEDILHDLFQDPRFQHLFQGLLQEFHRRGFRASQQFVQRSFFGNRGGLFFGGLFIFGSLAGPTLLKAGRKSLSGKKSLLHSLGRAIGSLLPGRQNTKNIEYAGAKPQETTYTAYLNIEEFQQGKIIELVTGGTQGQERLKVNIPPGSKAGQKLRLPGKGVPGPEGRGDLFLKLQEKS
jgi:curved DNA-binding protein